MRLAQPFETVTPTVDGEVLLVLAAADRWFPLSRVHTLVGERSRSGVRKTLLRLVEQGIVQQQRIGPQYSYRLNRDHLAATAVVELSNIFPAYLNRLRETLLAWRVPPVFAALFGSAATAEMRTDSDIDIFLVRPDVSTDDESQQDVWTTQIAELESLSSRWTGNDTRALDMLEADVQRGLEAGDQVLRDIRDDGILLVGSPLSTPRAHG